MDSYADALTEIKRRCLIIGVTGYTGSGCSTAARLLSKKDKPELPIYESGFTRCPDNLDRGRYEKIKRIWDEEDWSEFTTIEVSAVIFSIAINTALKSKRKDTILQYLRDLTEDDKEELSHLNLLVKKMKGRDNYNSGVAKELISSFERTKKLYVKFRRDFRKKYTTAKFIEQMQEFGDEIRRYGKVREIETKEPQPKNIFILPEALSRLIYSYQISKEKDFFVIDAFRNPYEVEYFKRHYSEFLLVSIMRNKNDRRQTLKGSFRDSDFNRLEKRENGIMIENRTKQNISEWVTSQNIKECSEKADVYIENINCSTKTYSYLRWHLIKLICLIRYPGCIPPTRDERCMQIATTAKQMSGCISRQVGAVVIGESGYVLGIGWNDPPEGQIPCALRTGKGLIDATSNDTYSEYERSEEFSGYIKDNCCNDNPFCFKDIYPKAKANDKNEQNKMPHYSRSLHAEENAFLQTAKNGGVTVIGSTLYTTASTCILCAKKAYQLGVKRIVFIDEYPDIGIEQTLMTGTRNITGMRNIVDIDPFEGIIGADYFRLFGSLMSEKDFINVYS